MENSEEKVDIKVLLGYLKGDGSGEGIRRINEWLNNSDIQNEFQKKNFQFWESIPIEPDVQKYNGESTLDHIHHRINIEKTEFFERPKPISKTLYILRSIAALMFIPLLISFFILYNRNYPSQVSESYAEMYAPFGTRTNFVLPDGSKGYLNGGSTLKFPTQFNGKTRNVILTGEAYFDIVKNPKNAFVVSTDYLDVNVYGTSFNVMAYPDENTVEVTLERGEVELFKRSNNNTESIGFLKPGESCIYNFISNSSKNQTVNTAEKLSWLEGKLTFKYNTFSEVIRKINRKYNVNIVIKDEILNSYVYYGTFQDETLDEVLNLLKYTAPIRFIDTERKIKNDGAFDKRMIEIYYNKVK